MAWASLIEPVALNLSYPMASPVYQSASVIHSFPWVDLASADCAGLVTHVIIVIIVILKLAEQMVTHQSSKLLSASSINDIPPAKKGSCNS